MEIATHERDAVEPTAYVKCYCLARLARSLHVAGKVHQHTGRIAGSAADKLEALSLWENPLL